MASNRPADHVNPTAMAHPASKPAVNEPADAAEAAARAAAQDLKRAEKVRSHASSHHTAGTVTPET